jgi:biotin-dependent carboxylase-like uncharacterized protein
MIEIAEPGIATSIQDQGRPGFERWGVPAGGAADWFSAAVANRLVGNRSDAALVEFTGVGPTLMFHDAVTIAITGEISLPRSGGRVGLGAEPTWRAHRIEPPTVLALGRVAPGLRGYLAVRGGINVPQVLASRSLCDRGGFGGGFGRRLQAGDGLLVGNDTASLPWPGRWPLGHRLSPFGPWEIRILAGPHSDAFAPDALKSLTSNACRATMAIDRMGLRIDTPGLHLVGQEILTTPVTAGSIQVTPSGELLVLFVDHPTTGGYPVIGTVITADLPLLAQVRPGDTLHFREVDQPAAASALRRLTDWLAEA